MTITIQLSEPGLRKLSEEAQALGLSIGQLAQAIIERHAGTLPAQVNEGGIDEALFQKLKFDTFRENQELYRRLAQ